MKNYGSIRPVMGLLLFLECLFWAGLAAAWISARALAPSLTFERMDSWPLLLLTTLSTFLMVFHVRWRHRAVQRLADAPRLDSVFSGYTLFQPAWKFLLWRWALAALVIGWLDPKMGSQLEEVESEGVDVMVAVDVSNSMLAEDVGMPRLDLAKRTVERLMAQTAGDRIGLVVFAGEAYVQCPLTTDAEAVKLFLASVHPGMVSVQGTAVGRAVETCWEGFDVNSESARAVVVITDGENHEDDIVAASRKVSEEGGSVHFMGLATVEGSPIPAFDSRGRPSGFREDASGNPVVSRLDESTLLASAQAGNGTYIRAGKGFVELTPFLDFKENLETAAVASVTFVDYEHWLMPWLILAAILMLLESLLPSRPFRTTKTWAAACILLLWSPWMQGQSLETKGHLVEGTQAFEDADTEAAIAAFGLAASDMDASGVALYNQGCAQMKAEEWTSATQSFERAAKRLGPLSLAEKAHYNASVSALMDQRPDLAAQHAKDALRIQPGNGDARHNLALAKRMMQQQDQQDQQDQQEPREGEISRADMERILESLERQEAEVQAKLRAAQLREKGRGQSKNIEKDW